MSSHMNVSLEVISMVYQSMIAPRDTGDPKWFRSNEKTEEIFQSSTSVADDHIPFEFPPPPKVPPTKHGARPVSASPHAYPSDSDSQSDSSRELVRSSPIAIRGRPLEVCGSYQSDGSPVSYQKCLPLPPIGVFWDIENCQVPKGRSATAIAQVVRDKFFSGYKEAEFLVVCDVTKESAQVIKDLSDAQVNLIHVSSTSKNAADEKLRQSIRRFADIHGSPAAIILISGDINFAADLNDLRHRKKIHVILLHNINTSEALILCANEHHLFSSLTESVPLKTIKRSDSPIELLISNLPEDQDLGRVKTRLKKLSDNCGGRVITISNSSATIRFSNFICASRAQKRMDGEDVYGRKISVGSPRRAQERNEREMSPAKSARRLRRNSRTENVNVPVRSPRRQKSAPSIVGKQVAGGGTGAGWNVAGSTPCFPSNPLDISLRRIHPAVLQQMLFPGDGRTQSVPPDFRMPMWPLLPVGQLPNYQLSSAGLCGYQTPTITDQGDSCKTPEGLRRIRGRHGGGQIEDATMKEEGKAVEVPLTQKAILKRCRTASPILPAVRPVAVPAVSGVPLPRKCRTPSPYTVYDSRENSVAPHSHSKNSEHFFHPISVPANSPVPVGANSPIELVVTNLDQTFNIPELQTILLNEFKGHVMVLNLSLCTHSDGSLCAYVKVPSLQDAQFAISKLHRRRLGSKRMIISYAQVNGPNPQVIRAQIVSLLRDVPGHCLPLFKFREMYESRYLATVSVADMYRMRDVCLISEDSSGRMVMLNPEMRNTPSPCPSDSSQSLSDQPIELPYCSLHPWRPNIDKGWAEQDFGVLPNVRIGLELLHSRINALLQSHQGRLPLPSLPTCYEAQFNSLEVDESGVPLEHLISCLRGVEMYQGVGSAKYLCWAKCVQDNQSEDCANISPPLASQLSLFCRELVDLLKTSPQCQLPFNRFIPAYHHHFGRQCRVADYGFTKLIDLLDALPNTVQVMGEGSRRVVTLSHRAQVRRFTTDVIRVLKYSPAKQVTLEEFPVIYQRVMNKDWNVVDYGVCTIEDLFREISESVVCVNWASEVTISLPKREQSQEEIERTRRFAGEVVELLRHAPQCSMLFSKFIPAYHQHFGHQCRLSDYGFFKLIELFESISDVVKVEDGFSDGERRVCLTLSESLKVLSEQLTTLVRASPNMSVQLSSLPVAYLRLYGHSLRPELYQCSSLRQLVENFPDVLKVVPGSNSDCLVVLVDQSDLHLLALQTRRVLMGQPNFIMTTSNFLRVFWRIYKKAYDLEKAKKELTNVVKIVEVGEEQLMELTHLQQFACNVYRLLYECKGTLKLLSFDFIYLRLFGVVYDPTVLGYPSIEAHLRAIPETVLLRGATRTSRTIILNKNLALAGFPLPSQLSTLDACEDYEAQEGDLLGQDFSRIQEMANKMSQGYEAGSEPSCDSESIHVSRLPPAPYQDVDSPVSSPTKLWSPPTASPFSQSFKVDLPASLSDQLELLSPTSFLLSGSLGSHSVPQVVPPHPSELPLPDPSLLWGRDRPADRNDCDVTDDSSPSKLANKRRIAAHFDML